MKRKICVVTGSRAEFGMFYWLMKEIESDVDLTLQVIVTGMHLSSEFGLTYKEIEKEFSIDKKVEVLLSSDSPIGVSKSMGLAQISFAEIYDELQPDLLLVMGDRFEIFSATAAAMVMRLPIAHISGGELTEGAIDEAIRHSITKMSHFHFTAMEEYRQRVIQLGEDPQRVFNVGEAGLDNIFKLKLLSRSEFEQSIDFKLNVKNLMITFHPTSLEDNTSLEQIQTLLVALDKLDNVTLIFTKSNADSSGRVINSTIDNYVKKNPQKAVVFTSLGQLRYLSALQYVDAIVGNSSSGIVEAPSFRIGTINIGDRQLSRVQADSVINCDSDQKAISSSLAELYTKDFQQKIKSIKNPYGDGGSSLKIKEILKAVNLNNILKKKFYDLEFNTIIGH